MKTKKNKETNIGLIIGVIAIFGFIGVLILAILNPFQTKKDKADTKTTDSTSITDHHPAIKTPSAPIDDLVGKSVPSFSLADRDGKSYSSENLRGKNVVLFFNEGVMCYPACWDQIAILTKDNRFNEKNTTILSVVVDSKEEWQKVIDQMPELSQAIVVFDVDKAVSKKLGMLTVASSMHYGLFPGHTYLVIDKEGIIRYVFDDPNMAINNDLLIKEIEKLN